MEIEDWKETCENYRDDKGLTPLHYAASCGFEHTCKYLIETCGVDIDTKDFDGNTALSLAVSNDRLSIVEYLIDKGANIHSMNEAGVTALHFAAGKEMVNFLMSKGADVDAPSAIGTPLQHAAQFGKYEVVEILLENDADVNAGLEGSLTPLMLAVCAKSIDCIDLLIKADADPHIGANEYNISPLCWAASMDDGLIIDFLLAFQPEVDCDFFDAVGLTPMEQAVGVSNIHGAIALFLKMKNTPSLFLTVALRHIADIQKLREDRKMFIYQETKAKGEDALNVKQYDIAINWFSLAEMVKPNDATISSYLSLCWACLHHASYALKFAQDCVHMNPLWSKAHLRAAVAWMLLENHQKATESFGKAFELDPHDKELREALETKVNHSITVARNKSTFVELVTCIGLKAFEFEPLGK